MEGLRPVFYTALPTVLAQLFDEASQSLLRTAHKGLIYRPVCWLSCVYSLAQFFAEHLQNQTVHPVHCEHVSLPLSSL